MHSLGEGDGHHLLGSSLSSMMVWQFDLYRISLQEKSCSWSWHQALNFSLLPAWDSEGVPTTGVPVASILWEPKGRPRVCLQNISFLLELRMTLNSHPPASKLKQRHFPGMRCCAWPSWLFLEGRSAPNSFILAISPCLYMATHGLPEPPPTNYTSHLSLTGYRSEEHFNVLVLKGFSIQAILSRSWD